MNGRSQTQESENQRAESKDELVDPRVQIELERLNTATDDINKLEVDLDDAKATFRELLCESTMKIDALAKKLCSSIQKSRPYYDARFKAKEALTEAQQAAIKFERANSQHAAAKEMVYLAEEGLKTEGRCFDHAWQEMLNHATSRVNESEHERAVCEMEHRRTTIFYHKAEHEVQKFQKELKRSIAKSRPFFETKAHFHQVLEQQKLRVAFLEKSVADAKMTYADALRNLEKISDEIHRNRQYGGSNNYDKELKLCNQSSTLNSTDSSGTTESPDSVDYTSDEFSRLPEKLSDSNHSPEGEDKEILKEQRSKSISSTEPRRYIKRERPKSIATIDSKHIPNCQLLSPNPTNFSDLRNIISPIENKKVIEQPSKLTKESNEMKNGEEWTEINLRNSTEMISHNGKCLTEEQIADKPDDMVSNLENLKSNLNSNRKKLITQKSLPATIENNDSILNEDENAQVTKSPFLKRKSKLDSCLATWISRNSISSEISTGSSENSSRRQSLDVLWNSGTGEKVKEFLNQGMMMLNISNLTDKRSSEFKILEADENNLEKKEIVEPRGKKVPSPLEKSLNYLHAEDETSDSESLTSMDMLSEDQISCLMMEPDINQVCQEVLGTPLVEICPLFQQLQQH